MTKILRAFQKFVLLVAGKGDFLIALFIRVGATLIGFAVTILIGRIWGPEGNGTYALAMQSGLLLAVIALVGTDMGIVRHFSANMDTGEKIRRAIFFNMVLMVLLFVAIVAGLLLLIDQTLYPVLANLSLPAALIVPVLLIFSGRALSKNFGAVLRSQKSYRWGQIVEVGMMPALVVMLILSPAVETISELIWAAAFASVATAILGFVLCLRYFASSVKGHHRDFEFTLSSLLRTSLPLWGLSLSLVFLDWYVLALTSWKFGTLDTGLMRVAIQYAAIMQIVSTAFFSIYSPQISASFHQKNIAKTGQLTRGATLLSSAVTAPLFIFVFIFAEPILSLVGPDFVGVATELRILAAGQLFLTMTGPCGITLAMAGLGRYSLAVNVCMIVVFCICAPIASDTFGLAGIAASYAIGMGARNIAAVILVKRLLGLNVMTGRVAGI